MNFRKTLGKPRFAFIFVVMSLVLLTPIYAQQTPLPTSSITFSGTIDGIDTRFIIVNGLVVNIEDSDIRRERLQLGANVTVVGGLQNGVIQAHRLQYEDDDSSSFAPTNVPPATATPVPSNTGNQRRPRIIIEGPVRQINPNSVRIFDQEVIVNPNTVNLTNIRVGDNVRIEGDFTIVNNTFNIVALNITIINLNDRRSNRDSLNSDRNSGSVRQPPPPPPPPANNRSSRSSVSVNSGRSS